MSKDELKEYNKSQITEIQKHKWIESEKAGHDLGSEAVKDWINKFAAQFREEWRESHQLSPPNNQ